MLLALVAFQACDGASVYVQFDAAFPSAVQKHIFSLLAPYSPTLVPSNATASAQYQGTALAFGNPGFCANAGFTLANTSEAFQVIQSTPVGGLTVFCADGNPTSNALGQYLQNSGRLFAAFQLLQDIGFSFFHPFFPSPPLSAPQVTPVPSFVNKKVHQPYYDIRGE